VSNNETERYNGWANRETWAVALHINNDQGWQESVLETVRNTVDGITQDPPAWLDPTTETTDVFYANRAGDAIRDNVEETLYALTDAIIESGDARDRGRALDTYRGIVTDIGSLWRVDWRELGAAFISDLGEADDVSSS